MVDPGVGNDSVLASPSTPPTLRQLIPAWEVILSQSPPKQLHVAAPGPGVGKALQLSSNTTSHSLAGWLGYLVVTVKLQH